MSLEKKVNVTSVPYGVYAPWQQRDHQPSRAGSTDSPVADALARFQPADEHLMSLKVCDPDVRRSGDD